MILMWVLVGVFIFVMFMRDEPLLGCIYGVTLWLFIGVMLFILHLVSG